MRNHLLLLISLISEFSFGQITGIVKDSITNVPIPYVNIWVENENTGTTSDEDGTFTLNATVNSKTFIFSSVGFETKKVILASSGNVVRLKPKLTSLQEVVVKPGKKKREKVIGSYSKSEIEYPFVNGNRPWILARFFDFKEDYRQTPFIGKIRIGTSSNVEGAKFNIRLYAVRENGEPGDYLYDKNIFGIAKKGRKKTEIDLSELHIKIPEQGIFIAVEGLIIESNRFEYNGISAATRENFSRIQYEPSLGILRNGTNEYSWIYQGGTWIKMWNKNDVIINELKITVPVEYQDKDPYYLLAVELTLTN